MLSEESAHQVEWEMVDDFVDTSIEMLLSEGKLEEYSLLKNSKECRLNGRLSIMQVLQTTCMCLFDYPDLVIEYQRFFSSEQVTFHNDFNRDGEFTQILISIAADLPTSTSAAAVIINRRNGIVQCTIVL
ncbi:uncharacterized protein LOC122852136 [Aphidius gifuensis]|uniref:uncharacterized protein LOC122852136 n=1 Tax=Aphidius gifuensis TaxID=684658 RepID=UPI001CDD77BC|nr:uncharacterized protein LOC122852136 [Aphidius gifuensis]